MRKRHIAAAAVFAVSITALTQASASAASGPPTGTLFHEVIAGEQSPLRSPAGSTGLAEAAIAALPNGSSQLVAVTGKGTLEHDIRFAGGSWQGWRTPTQTGVIVSDASIAGLPNGSSQVVEVTSAGVLKHDIRNADGSWQKQGWSSPAGSTGIAHASITGLPDGSSEILAVTSAGTLEIDTRNVDGSWQGWSSLAQPGVTVVSAAIAGLPNGTSQAVEVTSDNKLEYNARSANGAWQAAGWTAPQFPTDEAGSVPSTSFHQVVITARPNGSTEIALTSAGELASFAIHNANGSWSYWSELYENPAASGQSFDVSLAGMPNGTVQAIEIDQPPL